MAKNLSMDEIAKIFNVSKVTVSKALNDKPGVSESLRQEIKNKAEELGYRINVAARSLKTNRSYNIGILIAERYIGDAGTYYFGIYSQLTTKLMKEGYTSIMEVISPEVENKMILPQVYLDSKVDGIIVLGQLNTDYLKMFNDIEFPVLFFDFYISGSQVDSIIVDNFYSGLDITEYLINKGHKEIGFIGNIYTTSSIQDRFLGFYRALLNNHIPLNYDYVISDRDDMGVMYDMDLPEKLPTAIVCNNDQEAYYIIKKLNKRGIRVPDDLSVVSFDNTIFSTLSEPAITTLDTNVTEMVNVDILSRIAVQELKLQQ